MKINIKKLKTWITALRSGNYNQGKGRLQSEYGYCCLGVACSVLIPEDKQEFNSADFLHGRMPDNQPNAPQWLKDIDNDFGIKTDRTLAELNDNDGLSFNEIADVLEMVYILRVLD
jgi:hypothetical protein